jgi:hypothetical protein
MKFINATKIDRKFGKPTCPGVPWRDLRCALPSSNSLQLRPSISTLALVDVDGRKHCHSTNPTSLVYVLFHAFSKLCRPEGRLRANLDSSDSQSSFRDCAIDPDS